MMTNTFNGLLTDEEWAVLEKVIKDPVLRKHAAKRSFALFEAIYFGEYFTRPFAPFHKEFMAIAEDQERKFYVVRASRGFAKSTILNTHYAIWAILGYQQKKMAVIIAQTLEQAQRYMAKIRHELERNDLLRQDLGPFHESGEWAIPSIVVDNYDARIAIASVGSHVRGLTHRHHRPDLVILDDVENLDSVRTRENRDKTYEWFVSEVAPAGELETTKFLFLGTHLHDDSLVSRVVREIEKGGRNGIVRSYPFLDERGEPLWKARYPDQQTVEAFKQMIGDEAAFERECMLRTPAESGQIFLPGWVREFEASQHPGFAGWTRFRETAISVDVAGSKETSDYTAVVVSDVWRYEDHMRIYVLEAYNVHLRFQEIKVFIQELYEKHRQRTQSLPIVLTEAGGLQGWLADELKNIHVNAVERSAGGMSKEDRGRVASGPMQKGQVWFQRGGIGIDRLMEQLLGFGRERYDDEFDAFTQTVLYVKENNFSAFTIPGYEIADSIPFPAEAELARKASLKPDSNQTAQPLSDPQKKDYSQLTEEERKNLEHEEDLRLMRESEERRMIGLSG